MFLYIFDDHAVHSRQEFPSGGDRWAIYRGQLEVIRFNGATFRFERLQCDIAGRDSIDYFWTEVN